MAADTPAPAPVTTNDALPASTIATAPVDTPPKATSPVAVLADASSATSTLPAAEAAPTPTSAPPPAPLSERPLDPRIAPLVAMFPDFDHQLLYSVLDSASGDQDLAVDMLLEMTNPSYKAPSVERKSQSQLDEEMARRLAQEEEYAAAAEWRAEQQPQYRPAPQFRPSPNRSNSTASQHAPENDTLAQVQQQAMKFAETGKKALFAFAERVKQKINELDNPPPHQQQGSSSAYHSQQPQYLPQRTHSPPRMQQHERPQTTTHGYEVGPAPPSKTDVSMTSQPVAVPAPAVAPQTPAATSPSRAGGLSSSPQPPGMLPKRPVSLIDVNAGSASGRPAARKDDDDDLEYVQSPFGR